MTVNNINNSTPQISSVEIFSAIAMFALILAEESPLDVPVKAAYCGRKLAAILREAEVQDFQDKQLEDLADEKI